MTKEKISASDINAHDKELLNDLQDALANCMKCGNCMAVCPIYKETGRESSVARGKLALMEAVLKGALPISSAFDTVMAKCLNCKSCTSKCPCGVKADELILRGRQAAVKSRGLHPIKKNVFRLLRNRQLFDFALKMGGTFGPLTFKKIPGKMAAVSRFPMPGMDASRATAPISPSPLRSQYPEVIPVANPKMKVGFFTGCTINYMYTDVGEAVINVLKENNVEIVIPKTQHCCGTPVYVSGDIDLAKEMAKKTIETFENYQVDYIIGACGSCTEALKEYPHWLQDDKEWQARAEKIAKKTFEISEFLVDVLDFRKDTLGPVNATVTMHDPCHMVRGLKVTKQPRAVLKAIPGLKFVEMKDCDRCCGSGGSFSLANYELSRKINDKKVANIAGTKADIVATSCGTCRMHLQDGILQNHMNQDVVHTVQLLDKAYRAGKRT
ncbi:(Fe-S)-binding protein|uniref:Glycolate oxidase iron-sulfur subunit n=1 Tax=Dendrosporobacter quercicolus TaxID=146817 RepID=A0A1G9MWC7_9FIRM|nr:(Fe-S)-binding protein [Dendrosporobacter quercicolus]NSL47157.1 (Fe-S)-binding protein [Dendrosporobacter quercicolus DSM 1736]SDL78434.1 glycolate oxidase iron-sulfur subunit [Dendrosporobacter quercicolus]